MKTDLIKVLNDQNVKAEAPVIRIGDTVRVHIKIKVSPPARANAARSGTILLPRRYASRRTPAVAVTSRPNARSGLAASETSK